MVLGVRLDLKQSQQLVMTPQLQQAIRLLQMSNLELREFVEQALESNPLLHLAGGESEAEDAIGGGGEPVGEAPAPREGAAPLDARLTAAGDPALAAETFDTGVENLYDADRTGQAGTGDPWTGDSWAGVGAGGNLSFDAAGFDLDQQPDRPESLRSHLLTQLGQCRAAPQVLALARLIVEELDEHGYLRTGLAELGSRLDADTEALEAALALVQGCEPTGVGARDLAECLALQLAERDRLDPAMRRLLENLALVERGERRRLRLLCGVDEEDFADMLAELRALNPRPCAGFAAERAETVVADVLLRRAPGGHPGGGSGGGWQIELNPDTLPRLLIDNRYAAELAGAGDAVRAFVTDCRANANWLKRSLDQRARTILAVATEIVRHQDAFFAEGITGLRPLTLRMVAEELGMHESTVSRVTSNKYMATERGLFELKFFFTNPVGAEGLAAETVRHRIRAMVDAEPPQKILSDDVIVERLQKDGIDIARRTVAKYRKTLGIPSSVERRRLKALSPEL
jgi:RNA polymerase sigma-54 factor